MTDSEEWIKTADRLPEPYIHDYVWVAGEMKYDYEEEYEKSIDIGWLNPDNKKETEDYNKWSTLMIGMKDNNTSKLRIGER